MEYIRGQNAKLVIINAFSFSLSFQASALLAIVLPAAVLQISGLPPATLLACLAAGGILVGAPLRAAAGAWSNRLKSAARGRRPLLLWGAALDAVGLTVLFQARGLLPLAIGFLLATAGHNTAAATYESLWSDAAGRGGRSDEDWTAARRRILFSLLGALSGLASAWVDGARAVVQPMIYVILIGAALTLLSVNESTAPAWSANGDSGNGNSGIGDVPLDGGRIIGAGADPSIAPPFPNPQRVLAARALVAFSMTLTVTFLLYFFRDAARVASASRETAAVGVLMLVGAAIGGAWTWRLSHRAKRRHLVVLSILPMSLAAGGFSFVQHQQFILSLAVLFGLGYGAFVATGWAPQLDPLSHRIPIARGFGPWGLGIALPNLLAPPFGAYVLSQFAAPAAGYRALSALTAVGFLAGAAAVTRVNRNPRTPLGATSLRLSIAALLWAYLYATCHIEFRGQWPRRKGATLVISNHLHDLDGMVAPAVLTFVGPLRQPVYCAASQRLFEPGFLATRFPAILRPFLYRRNAADAFLMLGLLPIENQPLMRPLASYGHVVLAEAGDLPLRDVFTQTTLQNFNLPASARLSILWDEQYAITALTRRVSLTALREPHRTAVRHAQRARIEQQMHALKRRLQEDGTLYLTPEGRYSLDGRVQRLRLALRELLPLAERVYGVTINYDPFLRKRMSLYVRMERFIPDSDAAEWLARQRMITVSQVVAVSVLSLPEVFRARDVQADVRRRVQAFPPAARTASELARGDGAVLQCLQGMVRKGILQPAPGLEGESLARGPERELSDFRGVPDILVFLQQSLEETLQACRNRPAAPQSVSAAEQRDANLHPSLPVQTDPRLDPWPAPAHGDQGKPRQW